MSCCGCPAHVCTPSGVGTSVRDLRDPRGPSADLAGLQTSAEDKANKDMPRILGFCPIESIRTFVYEWLMSHSRLGSNRNLKSTKSRKSQQVTSIDQKFSLIEVEEITRKLSQIRVPGIRGTTRAIQLLYARGKKMLTRSVCCYIFRGSPKTCHTFQYIPTNPEIAQTYDSDEFIPIRKSV